ncbi:MAG: hypothetical protein ACOVNP_07660 [Flavobacterium sp.]
MTDIQKEYCEEKGLIYINPENTEIADYVNWLEAQIQALRIHDVSGRSEQLKAFIEWQKWDYKKPYDTPTDEIVSDYESL